MLQFAVYRQKEEQEKNEATDYKRATLIFKPHSTLDRFDTKQNKLTQWTSQSPGFGHAQSSLQHIYIWRESK